MKEIDWDVFRKEHSIIIIYSSFNLIYNEYPYNATAHG